MMLKKFKKYLRRKYGQWRLSRHTHDLMRVPRREGELISPAEDFLLSRIRDADYIPDYRRDETVESYVSRLIRTATLLDLWPMPQWWIVRTRIMGERTTFLYGSDPRSRVSFLAGFRWGSENIIVEREDLAQAGRRIIMREVIRDSSK